MILPWRMGIWPLQVLQNLSQETKYNQHEHILYTKKNMKLLENRVFTILGFKTSL